MVKKTLKEILKEKITDKELELVNRSFEIVGDIAIVEVPDEISHLDKTIATGILELNSSIKVILKKSGIHHGEFRTQNLIHIGGENRKETIYKENGCRIKINPETVYFSSKLSTEREKLLTNLNNKNILVMFSGSGPYSIVALRQNPDINIIHSIEINPEGHKYAIQNLELNKNYVKKSKTYEMLKKFLQSIEKPIIDKKLISVINKLKVHFINSDVRKIIPEMNLKEVKNLPEIKLHNKLFEMNSKNIFNFLVDSKFSFLNFDFDNFELDEINKSLIILFTEKFNFTGKINKKTYLFDDKLTKSYLYNYLITKELTTKYDEIYMPLPKDAEHFLDSAFKASKKETTIHMYDFIHENDFPTETENKVLETAKKLNKKIKIIQTRKVGQYSPRKYRVCCDFKILG
jgi:tRNA G37 N-methylase Trm5